MCSLPSYLSLYFSVIYYMEANLPNLHTYNVCPRYSYIDTLYRLFTNVASNRLQPSRLHLIWLSAGPHPNQLISSIRLHVYHIRRDQFPQHMVGSCMDKLLARVTEHSLSKWTEQNNKRAVGSGGIRPKDSIINHLVCLSAWGSSYKKPGNSLSSHCIVALIRPLISC